MKQTLKNCKKQQRMSSYTDKRINSTRRYSNYKYKHTQHGTTQICKEKLTNTGWWKTSLSYIPQWKKQKIKEISELYHTIKQMDLTFYPTAAECTIFSSACGTFLQDRSCQATNQVSVNF